MRVGSELIVQLVPLVNAAVRSIESERPKSTATHELIFQAAKIPPLGHKTYYILKTSGQQASSRLAEKQLTTVQVPKVGERVAINNGVMKCADTTSL